jgi:predicted dehydrogenase
VEVNMAKQLGAAIWGAGWVSGEHLRAWDQNPHCKVVAMGSRTEASVQKRLAETGVKDVAVQMQLDDILANPDVDVISICLPADLQAGAAIRAARAGKHVLVEKPIAKTPDELRQVRDAVRETGVRTLTSFCLRWNPMVEMTKRMIADGFLGKIIYARFAYLHELDDWYTGWNWVRTKAQGGSVTLLGGCHAIDAMLYLVGSRAVEVSAFSTRGHRDEFEYEPTIAGTVRFDDGALGHIAASQELHMPYTFPIELMGSAGAIRDGKVWSDKLKGQTDWAPIPTVMPDSGDVAHHNFRDEINHFVDCILNNVESHASVENTVHAHEVVFALDESAAQGGQVVRLSARD